MTDINSDLARLEQLAERLEHPGERTVRKQVVHNEQGRISGVTEFHEESSLDVHIQESVTIARRQRPGALTPTQEVHLATLAASCADAVAFRSTNEQSRAALSDAADELRQRAAAIAQAPEGHSDE